MSTIKLNLSNKHLSKQNKLDVSYLKVIRIWMSENALNKGTQAHTPRALQIALVYTSVCYVFNRWPLTHHSFAVTTVTAPTSLYLMLFRVN